MRTSHSIDEHHIRLPDAGLANLLGLQLDQYHSLKHNPLSCFTNAEGIITGYYMIISDTNDRTLLEQLNLNQNNYLQFQPEDVYAHFV